MLYALLGAALAAAFVLVLARLGPRLERLAWALLLVVAALIYVGFALRRPGGSEWLLLELGGVVLFSLFAVAGVARSPLFLSAGWVLHVAWDVGLHGLSGESAAFVPGWYPALCIGYDLVVGLYILRRHGAWRVVEAASAAAPPA